MVHCCFSWDQICSAYNLFTFCQFSPVSLSSPCSLIVDPLPSLFQSILSLSQVLFTFSRSNFRTFFCILSPSLSLSLSPSLCPSRSPLRTSYESCQHSSHDGNLSLALYCWTSCLLSSHWQQGVSTEPEDLLIWSISSSSTCNCNQIVFVCVVMWGGGNRMDSTKTREITKREIKQGYKDTFATCRRPPRRAWVLGLTQSIKTTEMTGTTGIKYVNTGSPKQNLWNPAARL